MKGLDAMPRPPGRTRSGAAEPAEPMLPPGLDTPRRIERSCEPSRAHAKPRPTSEEPAVSALAIERLQFVPETRALRLKLAGKSGRASIEVELEERGGELALTVETEDGDLRRADAWARAIDDALSRRGLRGEIVAR